MPKTSKKSSASPKAARVNKSAWIRSQAPTVSAKDVVTKAKAQGIKLSLAQVYTARSNAKRQGGSLKAVPSSAGRAAAAVAPRRGPGRPAGTPSDRDLRHQFVAIAVRIGTDEAQRLLDRLVDVQTPTQGAAAK
jgi:hypothetical protein